MQEETISPEQWAAICEALSALPPNTRRKLIELVLEEAYAVKDVAELMSVSPSAVSRYIHGTLVPGTGALCRLVMNAQPELRDKLLALVAKTTWNLTYNVLKNIAAHDYASTVIEEIADEISRLLETIKEKHSPRKQA
ncbi:MAG: hypothetical protein DSY37_01690 [Hyperthermus sp.]|nr:MAG: hypothetical protein DSY37_01690 [Hyperthermus sp.]